MESNRKRRYRKKIKKEILESRLESYVVLQTTKDDSATTDSSIEIASNSGESDLIELSSPDSNLNSDSNSYASHIMCDTKYEDLNSDDSSSDEEFNCEVPDVREIRQLQEWIVSNNVPHDHVNKLLKILRHRLLPSLPKTARTLLKCHVNVDNIEKMTASNDSVGEFKYFGLKDQLLNTVDVNLHDSQILELIINIDGMSPFKSSTVTVWPILVKVFTIPDLYEPMTVAVYSGNGKPKHCVAFLDKFIREIIYVMQNGIVIQEKFFKVKIKYFVCDNPARSFLKCVVGHVAFDGCERCTVKGKKVDGVTVFLQLDAEKRTNEEFRSFKNPECHTSATPLNSIECLDLVSQFILDPMHLLYLGCMKRIFEYLLSPSTNKIRLSATLKSELVRRTAMIKSDIPDEFPRKMRSTEHWSKYKAVEYKFFLNYAAPVVFKKLLPPNVYNNLMLFTTACRLLSDKRNLQVKLARKYFIQFVSEAATLYGPTFISLNVHNLIHVADDVENSDCSLSDLSAFPFESYLGSISAVLRSSTHIVAQYCRRVKEKEIFTKKIVRIPPTLEVLLEKKNQIYKIKYKGWILSKKHPNNSIILTNGDVADICSFNFDINGNNYIEVKKYTRKESLFTYPCNSKDLNIFEISKLLENTICIPLDNIKQKVVKFTMNFSQEEAKRLFIIPLQH